jgi:hypothetical protein
VLHSTTLPLPLRKLTDFASTDVNFIPIKDAEGLGFATLVATVLVATFTTFALEAAAVT